MYPEKLSILDAERAYDADSGTKVIDVAADDVVANDAVIAREDDTAQLAVPNVDPVCGPVNDPVIPLYTDSVSNLYINNLIISVFHINIMLSWK